MEKTELVIMAAGMGSRFGGLKQIAPVGRHGSAILDYSVYDAVQAGFSRAVVIITKEMEREFRDTVGKRLERQIDVAYAFQRMDRLPAGFSAPEGRVKPWGTGHAVLCAREQVDAPFAVINADDFYGRGSFALLHESLASRRELCMVGYELGKTLTENGTVSRGVCAVRDGLLVGIEEHTALDRGTALPMDTTVSMNMWGLYPDLFDELERQFAEFLPAMQDPLKSEFYLPSVIDRMLREGRARVRVLPTREQWYGVTYRDDLGSVQSAIREMTERGLYPDTM